LQSEHSGWWGNWQLQSAITTLIAILIASDCNHFSNHQTLVETTLFSPAWTFYYDQTESQGGKKYSVLMICIDKKTNLHQIGQLCTVHQKNRYDFHELYM
jgi:hypothetical protein